MGNRKDGIGRLFRGPDWNRVIEGRAPGTSDRIQARISKVDERLQKVKGDSPAAVRMRATLERTKAALEAQHKRFFEGRGSVDVLGARAQPGFVGNPAKIAERAAATKAAGGEVGPVVPAPLSGLHDDYRAMAQSLRDKKLDGKGPLSEATLQKQLEAASARLVKKGSEEKLPGFEQAQKAYESVQERIGKLEGKLEKGGLSKKKELALSHELEDLKKLATRHGSMQGVTDALSSGFAARLQRGLWNAAHLPGDKVQGIKWYFGNTWGDAVKKARTQDIFTLPTRITSSERTVDLLKREIADLSSGSPRAEQLNKKLNTAEEGLKALQDRRGSIEQGKFLPDHLNLGMAGTAMDAAKAGLKQSFKPTKPLVLLGYFTTLSKKYQEVKAGKITKRRAAYDIGRQYLKSSVQTVAQSVAAAMVTLKFAAKFADKADAQDWTRVFGKTFAAKWTGAVAGMVAMWAAGKAFEKTYGFVEKKVQEKSAGDAGKLPPAPQPVAPIAGPGLVAADLALGATGG